MPDLSLQAVAQWLAVRDRPFAASIESDVTPPEAPAASDQAVRSLGNVFDIARRRNPNRFTRVLASEPLTASLKAVLANLGPGRRLRLLDWFCDPEMADGDNIIRVVTQPDENGNGQTIREHLLALNKAGLLAKIFHETRCEALLAACRSVDEAGT